MAWTDKQRDAIESRNESLLVSAAAGSGKTSVLVERVTGLLKDGYDINRMLIVTFTNAAAAEMKERAAAVLGYAGVRHAHISTFHKFAIDIIRKYYHIINVNPSFAICDEYNQSIMKNDAMDEMFEALFENDDADFLDFLDHYTTAKDIKKARYLIFALHDFLQSLPNKDEFSEGISCGDAINVDAYLDFAGLLLSEKIQAALKLNAILVDYLLHPDADGAKPMEKLAEKLKQDTADLMSINASLENGRLEDAIKALSEFSFVRLTKTKDEKPSYELIADRADEIRAEIKDIISSSKAQFGSVSRIQLENEKKATQKPLFQLVKLCRDFDARYAGKKASAGLLDFSDIEHFALKILENKQVCEEIKESFDFIFVDEYQDSNLVQDELINRIAKEDNLFLVGDVKQSIYKFRLAEPELFIDRYEKYKNHKCEKARCIDLSSNFRSKGSVIDFVNRVFELLMTKQAVGIDYDEDARLYEGAPYTGNLVYEPKLYLISQSGEEAVDEEIEELKAAELEALEIARIIKEYHGKPIYDSKKKAERNLDYSDMVILLRSTKTKGEIIYQALENNNIPVFIERSEGYFDTPEIQVFLNLLRIIDNISQDVPLISVLHFPVFGFSAEELAQIRISSNEKGFFKDSFSKAFIRYSKDGEDEFLRNKAADFLAKIEKWKKDAFVFSLADFIWNVIYESGTAIFVKALPSGAQRFANLRALADKAQSYEEQNFGGLYGFISYIELAAEKGRGIDTGQVSMLGEGANAVRIMTIHKSKGLEFPFVLLAGLGSRFMSSKNKLHLGLHKDFGASIRLTEPEKSIYADPPGLGLINLKKEKEEYAETIRVLYVAMTRAKDILVMSSVCKDAAAFLKKDRAVLGQNTLGASNYLEMILPAVQSSQIQLISKSDLSTGIKQDQDMIKNLIEGIDSGFKIDESLLPISKNEIAARLEYKYVPLLEELKKSKYSVSEINMLERGDAVQNLILPSSKKMPRFLSDNPPDAASKGTAYHSVLEHIPFNSDNKEPSQIAEFIETLCINNIITRAEAEAIDPSKITAFFASDIGQRACRSSELHKETPFVMKSIFEGREVMVQGTIDCYFKEEGKYVLIDYKTSAINEKNIEKEKERIKSEYLPQLDLYRRALLKITGVEVKEAIIYLFGINDIIRL